MSDPAIASSRNSTLPLIPTLTTQNLSDLAHLNDMLHLFHHRNNLQHRRSPWYRHFRIFHRHLSQVSNAFTSLSLVPDTHTARHKKKATDAATRVWLDQELEFWSLHLVLRVWTAFTQLAADNRFAVLGIFLLAVLSQACAVLRVGERIEEMNQAEIERALEQFQKEHWVDDDGSESRRLGGARRAGEEDLGEVVVRDDAATSANEGPLYNGPAGGATPLENSIENSSDIFKSGPSRPSKPLKRAASRAHKDRPTKKARKNAIDELFSGL